MDIFRTLSATLLALDALLPLSSEDRDSYPKREMFANDEPSDLAM